MRTDKLSQAAITAVVQMARVLGMYTVAKRTDTQAEQEWLTALGVDFIQSNAMSPPGRHRFAVQGTKTQAPVAARNRGGGPRTSRRRAPRAQ